MTIPIFFKNDQWSSQIVQSFHKSSTSRNNFWFVNHMTNFVIRKKFFRIFFNQFIFAFFSPLILDKFNQSFCLLDCIHLCAVFTHSYAMDVNIFYLFYKRLFFKKKILFFWTKSFFYKYYVNCVLEECNSLIILILSSLEWTA